MFSRVLLLLLSCSTKSNTRPLYNNNLFDFRIHNNYNKSRNLPLKFVWICICFQYSNFLNNITMIYNGPRGNNNYSAGTTGIPLHTFRPQTVYCTPYRLYCIQFEIDWLTYQAKLPGVEMWNFTQKFLTKRTQKYLFYKNWTVNGLKWGENRFSEQFLN